MLPNTQQGIQGAVLFPPGHPLHQNAPQRDQNPAVSPATTAGLPSMETPSYGLSGAQNALYGAGTSALDYLDQSRNDITQAEQQGIGHLANAQTELQRGFSPYTQAGTQASNSQLRLSGAGGPLAQAQAFNNYQSSPYLDQVRENAERAILRNAAATGNLGSGNTLDQLYQNAAGLFMDDFNRQYGWLGELANRGLGAAGQRAGIGSNLSALQANYPINAANLRRGIASQMAQVPIALGSQTANYRYNTGANLASAIAGRTSALSTLLDNQGQEVSNRTADSVNNLRQLIAAATEGDAGAKERLAVILANISTGAATQFASVPAAGFPEPLNRVERAGQVLGGIAGALKIKV